MALNEMNLIFEAGCDPVDQPEALIAALTALSEPEEPCKFRRQLYVSGEGPETQTLPARELADAVRATFTPRTEVEVELAAHLGSERYAFTHVRSLGEALRVHEPNSSVGGYMSLFMPESLPVFARGRRTSLEGEAAALALPILEDAEAFLARLAGTEASRFHTVVLSDIELALIPPVEMSGSCTRRVEEISRDLVAAWIHLHDGDHLATLARRPLEELVPRVEAAPPRAQVGIALDVRRAREHLLREMAEEHARSDNKRLPYVVRGAPRALLPGDRMLTREQVLAVIATKPEAMLQALEAAAVPDEAWRNAEPEAREILAIEQALLQGEVDFLAGHHKRWIEQHAPFHVQRTPNGGVMLTTHPYRTLWPLWADALALLGIREADP